MVWEGGFGNKKRKHMRKKQRNKLLGAFSANKKKSVLFPVFFAVMSEFCAVGFLFGLIEFEWGLYVLVFSCYSFTIAL